MKPVVSIVTVVFNGEAELESTIRSVIGQTYFPQIEYIIIDGGSTDGTTSIIKRYEQYITRWVSEPDKGIYDAMNKAVGMARGEWINFMNCGDMFARDTVLENIFSKEIPDSISFLYSDYLIKTKHRTLRYTASFERGVLLHQSVIYRKSLHERFGFYLITPKIIISDY